MIRILAILPLLFLPCAVLGKTFECSGALADAFATSIGEEAPVLVIATIDTDRKAGTIEVADRKFEAEYQVQGLDRTWRFFTDEGQEYGYLFLIQPDGAAAYYDHETSKGQPTSPDQEYFCYERKIKVSAPVITGGEQPQTPDQYELAAYQFAIAQKIARNWAMPASVTPDTMCVVMVRQTRTGDVISARIASCNGDGAVERSILAAVERASPLPEPSDPELFQGELKITMRPEM